MSTGVLGVQEPRISLSRGMTVEELPFGDPASRTEPILSKVYKDTFLRLSASEEPPEIAVGDAWFDTCGLMPNVFVEGFGLIGLPLSDREAKYLAEVSPAFSPSGPEVRSMVR